MLQSFSDHYTGQPALAGTHRTNSVSALKVYVYVSEYSSVHAQTLELLLALLGRSRFVGTYMLLTVLLAVPHLCSELCLKC